MFLKVLTTAFVLCGLALAFAMPFVVGGRPASGDRRELAVYGANLLVLFSLTSFFWIAAAVGALVLMRRARRQYIEDQGENIKGLVEGALKDHERKE